MDTGSTQDPYPDLPACLRIPQAKRNQNWVEHPPQPLPKSIERTETERAYWQSVRDDEALRRAINEQRWRELKAKKDAEKAELESVAAAVRAAKRRAR